MPKNKRGRGEGTIRQRKDGLWEARISLGYNAEGKRDQRSVYGDTKKEVQDKLRELHDKSSKGNLVEISSTTVGEFLKYWLYNVSKPRTSPTTWERYECLARLHIIPHLGNQKLQALTQLQVQRLNSLIDGTDWIKKATVVLLHNALENAVAMQLISRNPVANVERAKPKSKEIRFLTKEETKQLLEAAKGKRLEAFFSLAIGSGMRLGEMLALTWSDIDFKENKVCITKSLAQLKGSNKERFVVKEPKSKQSKRKISLPEFVMQSLRSHKEKMKEETHNSNYVFVTKTGEFVGKSNLTRQVFKPTLLLAKLPNVRIHDLRHSHASALINSGASVKAVSRRLGHSTVELTLRVYAHILPDADDNLAGKAEELFT